MPPQAQRPNDASAPVQASRSPDPSSSALNELQSQLHDTQMSLASYMDKIHTLEGMLAEHEAIKREVSAMRELMEERKREMELLRLQTQSPTNLRRQRSHSDDDFASDDDDVRSISTVVPHELERVDEEDEESLAADEEAERRQRQDELRPRTPEPTGMGMHEDDDEPSTSSSHLRPQSPTAPVIPDELAQRLSTLSNQLESALELSRSLQQQHATAQTTISLLESKVATLESLVQVTQSQVQAQTETQQEIVRSVEDVRAAVAAAPAPAPPAEEEPKESITEMLNQWKKNVEGRWSTVQEEWNDERERLRRAKEEWEARVRQVETGLESTVTKVDSGLASIASFQVQQHQAPNGHAKLGLVTPPSPRSLSAESTRPRQKKRRSSTSRGRSRSRSTSPVQVNGGEHDETSSTSSRLRRRSSWATDDSDDAHHGNGSVKSTDGSEVRSNPNIQYPITPEPSLLEQPISGRLPAAMTEARPKEPPKDLVSHAPLALETLVDHGVQHPLNNIQTAFGVFVVVAAAAAVMWRVKPDGS